jgi:hypothetical protein
MEANSIDLNPIDLGIHAGEEYPLRLSEGYNTSPFPTQMLCPGCATDQPYVHWDDPIVHHTDHYTCPTGERGSWIDIPMWCEEGHHFHLVVAFHKGFTFLRVVGGFGGTVPLCPKAGVKR